MERIPASERIREQLKALMEGRGEAADGRSEMVRLAARLIIEEALEGEAKDAVGREYDARGGRPWDGYRNGYRLSWPGEERGGSDRVRRGSDRRSGVTFQRRLTGIVPRARCLTSRRLPP